MQGWPNGKLTKRRGNKATTAKLKRKFLGKFSSQFWTGNGDQTLHFVNYWRHNILSTSLFAISAQYSIFIVECHDVALFKQPNKGGEAYHKFFYTGVIVTVS